MIYNTSTTNVKNTHTVQEFISRGNQNRDHLGYYDFSYIEKRDHIEYVVKNILDDYHNELMDLAREVKLADWVVRDYRGNPKKFSDYLYGTTRYWHIILRINGMASVHEFNLENHKLNLIEPADLETFMSKVYNTEKLPLQMYANAHEDDVTPEIIERYVYVPDPSRKFDVV